MKRIEMDERRFIVRKRDAEYTYYTGYNEWSTNIDMAKHVSLETFAHLVLSHKDEPIELIETIAAMHQQVIDMQKKQETIRILGGIVGSLSLRR